MLPTYLLVAVRVEGAPAMSAKLEPVVYNEGLLLKRQRGLRQGNAKKLRFQERFCRLTSTSLDYYDPQLKKRVSLYFAFVLMQPLSFLLLPVHCLKSIGLLCLHLLLKSQGISLLYY